MDSEYDRQSELEAFNDSKTGVKGLIDAGVQKIPRMFIHPQHNLNEKTVPTNTQLSIPIIDLEGVSSDAMLRAKIIDEVRNACEIWGMFQIVNHGIAKDIMEEMIKGIRRFNEQDTEVKKEFYTHDFTKKVVFYSNFDLFQAPAATWKDTLSCIIAPDPPDPTDVPAVCRDIIMEYSKRVKVSADTLFELVAEALGLNSNHLKDICTESYFLMGHYYPACPEPELTLGTKTHTDPAFLTVLLQDEVGGLQVLHENQWVNVDPVPGALVINTGDLLQLLSNNMFQSVEHRVLANREGPRISVGCFFTPLGSTTSSKLYGPIKELLSEENPPKYKEITARDYGTSYHGKRLDGHSALLPFRL